MAGPTAGVPRRRVFPRGARRFRAADTCPLTVAHPSLNPGRVPVVLSSSPIRKLSLLPGTKRNWTSVCRTGDLPRFQAGAWEPVPKERVSKPRCCPVSESFGQPLCRVWRPARSADVSFSQRAVNRYRLASSRAATSTAAGGGLRRCHVGCGLGAAQSRLAASRPRAAAKRTCFGWSSRLRLR